MKSREAFFLSLFAAFAACEDSAGDPTGDCPAGSGAVFMQSGPQGPGCYCPEGTTPNATGTQCVAGGPCGPYRRDDGNGGCEDIDECAEGTHGCSEFADCTNVVGDATRCACWQGYEGDGKTCTCEGDDCLGQCVSTPTGVECQDGTRFSSLADPNGPYPHMQCAGTVGPEQIWFQTHTTSFPVDCRCPHGAVDGGQFCIVPSGQRGRHDGLGSGVNAADTPSGEIKGCATDFTRDVVYFGVNWADGGDNRRAFVFAMDPVTANRTLISGEYADPVDGNYERGAGESFDTILDMQLGADGYLYVFEDSVPGTTNDDTSLLFGRSVYRVDLTSGDRELWWNDRDARFEAAQCGAPDGDRSVRPDIYNHQFELDENDNIFMTTRTGDIIRVANDRSSCVYVTTQDPAGPGSGVDVSYDSGWGYDKERGVIYSTSFFGGLYKTNVATGHRSRLWGGPVGTGPGPGMWHFLYSPYLKLWIAGGSEAQTASYAAIFDPESGDTWGWTYEAPNAETGGGSGGSDAFRGPINTNPTGMLRGPILGTLRMGLIDRPWCLSPVAENRMFVATDLVGVVIVEMETGNTMNFSQ